MQQKVAAVTQPIVSMAAQSFLRENCSNPFEVINVADLGCSSGPNTFTVMSTVMESTVKICSELGFQIPEIMFYLNNLLGNDFNTLFKGLSVIEEKFKDVSWFAMCAPALKEEVEELVDKEGSFTTEFVDTVMVEIEGKWSKPEYIAKNIRAFTEAMISHQFGEEVMDKLYDKVRDILVEDSELGKLSTSRVAIVLELKKKNNRTPS
ncbi:hypothetical protein DITRI_Ditri09bG0146900 [Diplodiscus trichospermus]